MADAVVETIRLKKTFYNGHPVEVLHGIDLRVKRGEFVAVLGQSGSGKSTLLNCLGALDRPTDGQVLIEGNLLSDMDQLQLAELRNERIGFIFQFHYLLDEWSCLENALMPVVIRHGKASAEQRARVADLLQRVGLGHRLNSRPSQMSGGEQQRTAIVRALANSPSLVLADEPTGNLDSKNSGQVFELMREMNQATGAAFVMVTHAEQLSRQADRIVRVEDGRLYEG